MFRRMRLFLFCTAAALFLSAAPPPEGENGPTSGGKTLSEWVDSLRSQKFEERAAAQALAEIGPEAAGAVPALIEALRDKEFVVPGFAARALDYLCRYQWATCRGCR